MRCALYSHDSSCFVGIAVLWYHCSAGGSNSDSDADLLKLSPVLTFAPCCVLQVMQQAVTEPVLSASRRRAQAAAQGKAQDKHAVDTQVR
jgi:hypothetical protein